MVYEEIFKKAKEAVKIDYEIFGKPYFFDRALEDVGLSIDSTIESHGSYIAFKIKIKSGDYNDDVAFLLIYHELLHCVFYSLTTSTYFRDSVANNEKKGIPEMLINIIQDMLFDYQMKIKYGYMEDAWKLLNKSGGSYKVLSPIHEKLMDFIKKNKIDLELVDLGKIQKEVLDELREDIVKNYGREIKYN